MTHIPSTADTLRWGRLPGAGADAVATVASGAVLTLDTLSHEGALPDQGGDPLAFFARHGVEPLPDLLDVVPRLARRPDDGPHFVTGPVRVEDAEPGDLLQVDVLALDRRADHGVITDRHAKDVFGAERPPGFTGPVVSTFCRVAAGRAYLDGDPRLSVPLAPFLGIMGVAAGAQDVHSGPPGPYGGNLDLKHLVAGTTLFLPVLAPGALFYAGDPHFAQGNGELASTALEAPLRATLRLTVHKGRFELDAPVARTPASWIVCGLDRDLGRAVRAASAAAVRLLGNDGVAPDLALAWLSVAGDVEVTQVVDGVLGAHVVLPRSVDLLGVP
ncbi:acetamidase/formamidase family protein [Dactylosporangium sp. AC04546]|uniref:acetamidase/formamidase family protein n=1 Tax=Dactylosporangium sp. AC04546 TaxID=2862460 RepID=UPI001EDD0444|nr:acetamidase/formamidase family protein [Dactylosporangium sp. AC04546]WVK79332.1 acetamidase/formamidase family protein [Dactylosporangium sp. AC04546]